MYNNLERQEISGIIQRALDILNGHKTTMLGLKMALDNDKNGFPHLTVNEVTFPEGWFPLPDETFRGVGQCIVLDHSEKSLVLYYKMKAGSYFVTHSVEEVFHLHICYGKLSCSVSGYEMTNGATYQTKPNQLHQLCFPVDTGMTVTFELP